MPRQYYFRNRKIPVVSLGEFASIIQRSRDLVKVWIRKGVLLEPTFSMSLERKAFGRNSPYLFYSYKEALFVRELVSYFNPRRGKPLERGFVQQLHSGLQAIRHDIKVGDYAYESELILEFRDYTVLYDYVMLHWASTPEQFAENLWKNGNLMLHSFVGRYPKQNNEESKLTMECSIIQGFVSLSGNK